MPESSGISTAPWSQVGTKRQLVSALLSALVPGAGQLLVGQRRKGLLILSLFVALVGCMWPLRMPRFFAGLILLIIAWLAVCAYATCAALVHRQPPRGNISKWWLLIVPLLVYLGINLVFTPILLLAGFRALEFGSSSMQPTLLQGDYFIIDANYYRKRAVQRDDLVVLQNGQYRTVKRIIAVAGDNVEGKDRAVILNGRLLEESFVQHAFPLGSNPELDTFGPFTVPNRKYFVMGDNRDISLDSRTASFGLLNAKAIVGKPLYIYRSQAKDRLGRKLQ